MSETPENTVSEKDHNQKHGKLLTVWLALMLVANIGTALMYLLWNSSVIAVYPNVPLWVWYIYGLLGLCNVVFTVFLYMWKKWAFFAFCGIAVVVFILNLTTGVGAGTAITGFAGPVILYLLIRPQWNLLK